MTVVRPADAADLPAIVSVFLRCWTISYREVLTETELAAWTTESATALWQGHLVSGETTVLVGEVDGRVEGVARCHPGWLDSLYVDPDASGRGLGRALVDDVLGRTGGRTRLWVFEPNRSAQSFYGRLGFTRDARRRLEPGYTTWEVGMIREEGMQDGT